MGHNCRVASRCVNTNSSNCNFNVRNVNSGKMNANNMFNSNGNTNNNSRALFPVASILLWLYNYKLYKGRIETNYVLLLFSEVIKLKQMTILASKFY